MNSRIIQPPSSSLFVEFEEYLKLNKTLTMFLATLSGDLTVETLFSLIGIDIENRFKTGKPVDLQEYHSLLPVGEHARLDGVCADSIGNFVSTHCPVREVLGPLPALFGKYRFMNEIARGGNGVVYEVEDTELKRRIAIKVLFRNCRTLSNEAKIMSQLDHPNICSIYDAGEFHHRTFVAMQLIQGPSLTEFCRTPAVLSCQQVVEVMVKALDVVGKCHSMGIVHLDLKPANILMSGQEPVIIDFGLARTSGIAQNVMQALGSPSYMAPELFANELYTPATMCDLFSMGVIFYELLTGKRPFTGLGEGQNHVFPPRRPRDHRNEIPDELERICLRAISESPSQRYQSAQDFQSELLYWLQSSGGHSSVRTSLAISVDPPSRVIEKKSQLKYWVITWFLLLLVLIVNLIGLVF